MDMLAAVRDLIERVETLESRLDGLLTAAGLPVSEDESEPESVSGTGKVGAVPEPDEDSGPIEGTMTTYSTPEPVVEEGDLAVVEGEDGPELVDVTDALGEVQDSYEAESSADVAEGFAEPESASADYEDLD